MQPVAIAVKQEYSYGNTQIEIDPWSTAALSLNAARNLISNDHLEAAGKDVDPNHVTLRYGLLNEDLDELRTFLAQQTPFEVTVGGIELFPASEHSDGAVPVVARIYSPELHALEEVIGEYADFKHKSFPVYKPHCTLAYCKPERAEQYAALPVGGVFRVHSVTISHASGVQETIPFGMANKWDSAKHPRDEQGQFAATGTVTVEGREIEVVKPKRARRDTLIPVDVAKFEARWSGDTGFYLTEGGGKNAIGDRYARFGEFIAQNDSIEASEVYFGSDGRVGFTNGRHRFAWLRDHGVTTIPVAVDRESLMYAKKFGYIAAQKWDESQHPRDKEGQFTESGEPPEDSELASFEDYEAAWAGGVADFGDPEAGWLIQTHPEYYEYKDQLRQELEKKFGESFTVYRAVSQDAYEDMQAGANLGPMGVTTDIEVAKNWVHFAGNKDKELRILKATIKPEIAVMRGKEEESEVVIDGDWVSFGDWEELGTATDKGGFVAKKFDEAQHPRDPKTGRFTDLGLHGDTVTVLHGTTRRNAEAILKEGFKPGNPAAVAAQIEKEYNLPEGSIYNHVAFEFAKGRRDLDEVHFTTDESVADQYSVPEVMQDALMSAYMLTHPIPEDQPFTKELAAERKAWINRETARMTEPALLAVSFPYEVAGEHAFGKHMTVEEFNQLTDRFDVEDSIFNNIRIPIAALTKAKISLRKWDGSQHPRDEKGQFTEVTGALERAAQSPEFKAWFGASKTVDERGKPVIMWRGDNPVKEQMEHGTIREGVTRQQVQHPDVLTGNPAIYLTPDEDRAYWFATSVGYENYARPFFVKAESIATPQILRDLVRQQPDDFDGDRDRSNASSITASEVALLQQRGYDALMGKMDFLGGGGPQEIAVFSPTQVKGIENLTFDPKNPHIFKWDESQHPRDQTGKFRGKSSYQPDNDAPKEGEWDWTGVDRSDDPKVQIRNAYLGIGPKWRQQHLQLVADALQSWVGSPDSFRLHSQDAMKGAPIPDSGSGKHMRAQAEALLWELEHKAIATPELYRGSGPKGDRPGSGYSWSEDRNVAKVFAKRYGGRVETLPAGAKGLKLRDYAGDSFGEKQWVVRAGNNPVTVQKRQGSFVWDESKHPRNPSGSSRGGEFTETLHGPKDALDSLLNGEKNVSIDRNDVRKFLELAGDQLEDPDLTDLQVEGMQIFGGNGLGIDRADMPQIPKEHREGFLEYARKHGVRIDEDEVNPLELKPTQNQISARNVAEKLKKYEKGGREFPPILVARNNRVLDGHHHWGMMAAFALDYPQAKVPVYRFNQSTKHMLGLMFAYMKLHNLKRKSITGVKVAWDEFLHPRGDDGRFVVYHGTDDKSAEGILQSGMKPGKTGVNWATTDLKVANILAERRARDRGGKPVILEVTIPAPESGKLNLIDFPANRYTGEAAYTHVTTTETIPASWMKVYTPEKPVPIAEAVAAHKGMEMVSVKELEQFRTQDRRVEGKSSYNITEPTETLLPRLTEELRAGGAIKEPLTLSYDTEAGRAILMDGNTRLAAIADAGFTHAPVVISRSALHGFGREVKKLSLAEAGITPYRNWLLPSEAGFSTLKRAKKWDENEHPRDRLGQFTESEKERIGEAIRGGKAHTVTETEFLNYHYTGAISSSAYERYEKGEFEYIKREDFKTPLDTREVNGQTVEILERTEPIRYAKRTVEASEEERNRLYEEFQAAAKALGTDTMSAGIDLGRDSDAYKGLMEYEKRWLQSGSEYIRDEKGELIYMTPEEIKAKGLQPLDYTIGAFVGDKAIGYAGDEFGASGVYLSREYQRHGIGSTLLKTYLEKTGRLAKGRQFGQMTYAGQQLTRALHRQLVKEAAAKKADPVSGRYVTPFVSFDQQGDDLLRLIASLNSSRLATWGFTAEAEVRGLARYRTTAVLDGRTSVFCRFIDGKIFEVTDAREKVIEALNVQNPEDLKQVQPWPKQTKAAMEEFRMMTNEELVERGLHIPPYHPFCRTLLKPVQSSAGELSVDDITPTLPEEVETFQPVTASDLAELGIEATPEQVDQWNANIGMSPVELLSKLSGITPQEVMEDGVGPKPVQFDDQGNIAFNTRGEVGGVEFKLGALLDPFTGTYYLNYADLVTGTPAAEVKFLKRMFNELIGMGEASPVANSLAVGVAGNAAYYAKLGFLPDDIEWDAIRYAALDALDTTLQPVITSLALEDQKLVRSLLQDQSVSALSALVDLPFTFEGRTLGEWILGDVGGTWALDLLDEALVAQTKAYLS